MVTRLTGQRVKYVSLGHAVVLGLTGDLRVLIEAVAHLDGPGGRADVEPGDDPSDALAALLGDVVRTARASENGELEITFDSGSSLVVEADTDAESWAVCGPGGELTVCVSRGEVAVWRR